MGTPSITVSVTLAGRATDGITPDDDFRRGIAAPWAGTIIAWRKGRSYDER
jgi:hypothetical protein